MNQPTTIPLTKKQQRTGMRLAYLGQATGAILPQLLIQSAFGVLFIKHLGGSDFQAMLLGSLLLLPRILQIPISLLVPPSAGKRFMLRCWIANGLAIAAILVITSLPIEGEAKVPFILLFTMIGAVVSVSGATFWFPLLHDVVPDDQRGRFFGKMRTIWNSTTFAAILITAAFLGNNPSLWRFQVVLAVGLALYFTRNVFIARLPEGRSHAANNDYANWKQYVRHILSRREVLIFCGYYSLLACCMGFLSTPLVLYMKQMGFPMRDNIIIFGFSTLGKVLSLLLAGVLTDRIGTKRVFLVAHIVLCAVCFSVVKIGWLPTDQARYLMPIAMMISGGMLAMAGVACTAQLFHLAPDRGRAFFMSLTMILLTAGTALSPILVGYIRQSVPDTWTTFLVGMHFDIFQLMLSAAGLAMLALIVLLIFVEDIRPETSAARTVDTKNNTQNRE
jgi:MFS family permease